MADKKKKYVVSTSVDEETYLLLKNIAVIREETIYKLLQIIIKTAVDVSEEDLKNDNL